MFIVRVQGGLGNQLFQYSLARSLSARTGQPFKLDFTSFGQDTLRKPELSGFRADLPRAGRLELSQLKYGLMEHARAKLLRRQPRPSSGYVKEKSPGFDPSILSLRGNVYLDGYWQSERYFGDFGAELREAFVLGEPLPPAAARLAETIDGCEAVSMHVRRGDYVNNPANRSIYCVCGLDYYLKAANHLASGLGNPRFFVFSDDPAWVREHLVPRLGGNAIAVEPSASPVHDLHLMSRCRHHVIANSSFSWWGAWLNPRADKRVIVPARWFKDDVMEAHTRDMLPATWERL